LDSRTFHEYRNDRVKENRNLTKDPWVLFLALILISFSFLDALKSLISEYQVSRQVRRTGAFIVRGAVRLGFSISYVYDLLRHTYLPTYLPVSKL